MVRLTRIYTRTGDAGDTGLGDGSRVPKDHLRVEAYGTVDEANAALGLCVLAASRDASPTAAEMLPLLRAVQNELFDCGADLCCPIDPAAKAPDQRLRVTPAQTARLEAAIDRFNGPLKPLDSFVLPGGSELAVALHLARTVARRAERRVVTLAAAQPGSTNPETIKYLNRLSDLLFVLARAANQGGPGAQGDVLWVPGSGRPT
ncbi:MAG: cob(I)yrinic acid a,c-diamide adenosyltransferase [Phycisphaerae bacterium]|nr:cob(I)yrinic acid a,c-diamide adenosyltransferase [Phycisphaerae bacterium]